MAGPPPPHRLRFPLSPRGGPRPLRPPLGLGLRARGISPPSHLMRPPSIRLNLPHAQLQIQGQGQGISQGQPSVSHPMVIAPSLGPALSPQPMIAPSPGQSRDASTHSVSGSEQRKLVIKLDHLDTVAVVLLATRRKAFHLDDKYELLFSAPLHIFTCNNSSSLWSCYNLNVVLHLVIHCAGLSSYS